MTPLKNDRFIRALLRQPVDRTPIWIMRQAGRYLPEYRQTRAEAGDFMSLCKNPELACEVTMQPLRRYDLDAAILFSDILTIPDAMGLGLYFVEGEGPRFKTPVRDQATVDKLSVPDMQESLGYVMDAVKTIKKELDQRVPLIGFSGSPWTLATYMVEGGSSKLFSTIKTMLYAEPTMLHQILDVTAKAVTAYLNAQIESGVDAVMIFDTWGGALGHRAYQDFSLAYTRQVIAGLKREYNGRKIPVIAFTKGGGIWLEQQLTCGADAFGLDWTMDVARARTIVGDKAALQGNMDPCVLRGSDAAIRKEVARILAEFGQGSGHVFNLGHGVPLDIDPEKVKVLVDTVHELSPAYH
jgi:uroporphyrinogen decarboxylase